MSHSIQLQIIAALAIITLIGLAVWAYRSAQKAHVKGYDLGYDDAKRGHELRIADQQHEIEHLQLKAVNQRTAHQLERDAIIQDADARIAIYASRAMTSVDIQNLRIANKQLLLAAQTYTNLKLPDQARFATTTAQAVGQMADRSAAALPAATPAADDILTFAANVSPNGKSWLVYGPEGCGKTTNARAIADALGLTDILDTWQPNDRAPTTKTLVLTTATPPFPQFIRRVLSFDQAMSLVASKKGVAA
ncbi:AAA family ATPase [Pseudomonas peli]|uniref:AAA family ATPase n=1 Tax=Pseudomonas peli TaxID=592361 RepID=UPI0028617E91|nr:AAA family ATPase [Pseudomonas peli]MDR7024838.1 DNA replication protein DnaC [Pseudomonas peli]